LEGAQVHEVLRRDGSGMCLDLLRLLFGDQQGYVDVNGTDFVTEATGDAEVGKAGLLEAMDVGGPRDADRTRIDVPEHMAARDAVGRADVHAGPATDAIQRIPENRVGPHPGPSIV